MELEQILWKFEKVKKMNSNSYQACCPAHDDHNPSLALYVNGDWVNVHCFAGCSKEKILSAVGLSKGDLYLGTRSERKGPKTETHYSYHNADGTLSYTKRRYDFQNGSKKFGFFQTNGDRGLKELPHLLYNLPAVINADRIYFVEGEKCADAVIDAGYTATTLDAGASSKWDDSFTPYLENKEIIIIPDNDEPGLKFAKKIKENVPWAKIKILPGLQEKEDIYDWLQAGHTISEIDNLDETVFEEKKPTINDSLRQSEIMLNIIKKKEIELFLNENNMPFAVVPVDNHKEIVELESTTFSLWAQLCFYKETGRTVRNDSLKQVINTLIAETRFGNKPSIALSNRIASHDKKYWYDLTNADWQVICIDETGWKVLNNSPNLFCRYRHQQSQIVPKANGDICKIFDYINIRKYKTLFICWLISCFIPDIPHPMPIVYGEKGAAKSTACVLLKKLIDPSVMDTLTLTRDEKSLLLNLKQHYYLPFDNVSAISNDISDTLCRAITGGAVQHRKLFTDAEDYIFTFKRCLTINGINNVANRSDLLDRSIMFELVRVSESNRKELYEVYTAFEQDRPYLLGSIFDVLSKAIAIYPTIKLEKLPRMADFCRWGFAIGEALGGLGDEFLSEYEENYTLQNHEAINADAVAYLIVELMRGQLTWNGRVSELLKKLKELAEENGMKSNSKSLPNAPNALSRRIKAIKSNLEKEGITFSFEENHSSGTYITLNSEKLSKLPPYQIELPADLQKHDYNDSAGLGDDGDNGDNSDNIEF